MLTEEAVLKGKLTLRRDSDQLAYMVAVGLADRWMVGQVLTGLPVVEWPFGDLTSCQYVLVGTDVQEPEIACAELGME